MQVAPLFFLGAIPVFFGVGIHLMSPPVVTVIVTYVGLLIAAGFLGALQPPLGSRARVIGRPSAAIIATCLVLAGIEWIFPVDEAGFSEEGLPPSPIWLLPLCLAALTVCMAAIPSPSSARQGNGTRAFEASILAVVVLAALSYIPINFFPDDRGMASAFQNTGYFIYVSAVHFGALIAAFFLARRSG